VYVLEFAGQDDPFAAREAATAASGVTPIGPGVATAAALGDTVDQLAFTRRASTLLGTTDASVGSAVALLRAAATDGEGSVAVRARDVRSTSGVSTQTAERELGAVLADRGHAIDLDSPDRTLVALFAGPADDASAPDADPGADGVCALGWRTAEPERSFADRTPTDRPFFQPGSMDPQLARALVNLAGGRPGATVLDPMCGTGGLLIEAGRVGATPVGGDAQRKMVAGTRRNLDALLDGPFHVYRGDAARPPIAEGSVDGVVFDAPYGRQSKIAGDLDDIVADCLGAAADLAPRAVVVGDRSWADTARAAGWTVESTFVRRVHRSLDRYVAVLRTNSNNTTI
jgi:tRNA (guanine10-N2)-dimethyltransferase